MKKLFSATLFALIACALTASAGGPVAAKTWSKMQTYEVRTLAPAMASHMREFVAVKFNFRGKDIHHLKPNWYEGSLWQTDQGNKKGFTNIRVLIAKKDLEAFKSITTDAASPTEITVYGPVLRDTDSNFLFVQPMGRNATVDANGNATITW